MTSGKCMSSSMVSGQINSFWSKSLGKDAERMNARLIRKTAVTVVHEKHKDLKKGLANLMTHSQRTAEKYYNIQEKGREDAKTAEHLYCALHSIPSDTASSLDLEGVSLSSRHKWNQSEVSEAATLIKGNIESDIFKF